MTRLILWRHGQTAWNAEQRVQGQTDTDLSEVGRRQAAEAAVRLAALKPDQIVASDLRRAADTAAELAKLTGLTVRSDARLRERNFGPWQGHLNSELVKKWPREFNQWLSGHEPDLAGVETVEEMAVRTRAALIDAAALAEDGVVVVATHGGTVRHGIRSMLGWPELVLAQFGGLHNCHWSELRRSPTRGWQLWAHNVGAHHLRSAPDLGRVDDRQVS